MRDVLGGDRFQEAAPHDESAEGGAGDGGAEGGGVSPGDCPPRHCHALPHLSHSEVRKERRMGREGAAYQFGAHYCEPRAHTHYGWYINGHFRDSRTFLRFFNGHV